MSERPFYHAGSRGLQDRFGTRPLADRMTERVVRAELGDADRELIERCSMFFLATADGEGRPDCSYKGGDPGFVRVLGRSSLAFPSYDGNGMFRTLGNVAVNPHVGLLFIDFEGQKRIRVNGRASLRDDREHLELFHGAELAVRVEVTEVFPNCSRYIHRMTMAEPSVYVPRPDAAPPRPAWKDSETFRDVVPPDRSR